MTPAQQRGMLRPPAVGGARAAAVWALAGIVALTALIAACGPTTPGSATPPPSTAIGGTPGPKPTLWPTLTVEAAVALGAANGEFSKMSDDLAAAIDSEDPARLRTAIGDALTFLEANQENIPRLQAYDATKSVGDRLAAAYSEMIAGATQVRDGLDGGDGDAVTQGFATFFAGSNDYAGVAAELGDLASQAILMKRNLLK